MDFKRPPKVEKMTEEQLKLFVKKKQECDTKAQNIVMTLLENTVTEETFIGYLPYITQSHYEDITVERAIIKICGYPICKNMLDDKLPKQPFKICTKTNKIYDITLRKNFCSNQCYKSSGFIKDQILTSPLWFRNRDDNPTYKLLPLNTKGLLGEVVQLSLTPKVTVDKEENFTSLLDFTKMSLDEMYSDKPENNEEKASTSKMDMNEQAKTKTKFVPDEKVSNKSSLLKNTSESKSKKPKLNKKIIGEVFERKSENRIDPMISAGEELKSNLETSSTIENKPIEKPSNTPAVSQIEKSLGEWFGIETLIYLLGENKVKELVNSKSVALSEYLNNLTSQISLSSGSYNQYQRLCKKLNFLELEDKKYDHKLTQENTNATKPLPDYSILKDEGKKLEIKVKAFFEGKMEIPKDGIEIEKPDEDDDDPNQPNILLVNNQSQHIMRVKIVLSQLDKVLPDLLQALNLSSREISGDISQLVESFNLKPNNIYFKGIQWNLVAIIIIRLLSIKGSKLKERLNMDTPQNHLKLMLLSYGLDPGYLDRLIWWLTDVDRILEVDPVANKLNQLHL